MKKIYLDVVKKNILPVVSLYCFSKMIVLKSYPSKIKHN